MIAVPDPDPDGEGEAGAGGARSFPQELKEDPGPLQLETLLAEIVKLERVKAIGLPEGLFEGVSEKVVEVWRARAMRMYPSDFAAAPEPIRLTLMAALCWVRKAEMIDGLVELRIQLVHKISLRAEKKVENELSSEFRRVQSKHGILARLAQAALDLPEGTVRFSWTHPRQMTRLVLPGGIVAYGKTGARYGYAAGVGATRDLSRTLVYSVNSTDAKASEQNQRTSRIALAAFAK